MVIYFWIALFFLIGAVVGSFLNVCIARLPYEKSVLWPGSRCGVCFQPVRWYDNIPLISYWLLRGRCRQCGAKFSPRYFIIELLTALGFVGLFHLEVVLNIHNFPARNDWNLQVGLFPWEWIACCFYHCLLFSFLLALSACDIDSREIPLGLTMTGALVGLIGAILFPWPWPQTLEQALTNINRFQQQNRVPNVPWWALPPSVEPGQGVYPWPVWWPLPEWLPPGSWQLGLTTGLAGLLVGTVMMRAVRFLFTRGLGKEAMGLGDADVMMLAGAFIGWQPVAIAFFVSVLPALVVGIIQLVIHRDNTLPFGPSLAMGVLITVLCWQWVSSPVRPIFFWPEMLLTLIVVGSGLMFGLSFLMRLLRR